MKETKNNAINKQGSKGTSSAIAQPGSGFSSGWNFDFVGKRKYFLTLSAILIVISLISMFTKGFNFGLEFIGGSEIVIETNSSNLKVADVRAKISDIAPEFKNARILQVQAVGQGDKNTFSIVVSPKDEKGALRIYTADEKVELIKKVESAVGGSVVTFNEVSGDAANEMKSLTWKAVVFTLLAMLVYIAIRFKFVFGVGAVLALIHDVIITAGMFSLFGIEMNVSAIAALLTLVGYSVNDTIVVFDRIREFGRRFKGKDITVIVNDSINSTLTRTINTSLTTFFTVLMLLLFATGSIKSFGFGMSIGVVIGTYSSMFIASPVVIRWAKSI
ncbi:MAG TPA: protein translocase subunit SecF [Fervidobacterium sp.]|nr:protein translocase subunit SecF [Fervidobacterium sp.]NLH36823.1 protein translocase subunit SecF [Thermotogaceae bacterium]MBP9517732.1 protein translocase subunit SecF [Fervidobacterium sp.]HCL98266.1 protein translocase subunit SecF [Fervidobacterium sp.]HOH54004.1 protein translocase subunit SecF [Fervidobacterium sp.]